MKFTRPSLIVIPLLVLACVHVRPPRELNLKEATILVDGRERSYLYWDAGEGTPLVLSLHGRRGSAPTQEKLATLLPIARREDFTLVMPQGLHESWHDARDYGPSAEEGVDDEKFLSVLIDHLITTHHLDRDRVYVIGMSNGGFMALTLACRLSPKLAGVASVTGQLAKKLEPDCPMQKPIPVALFLGTDDPLVPFEGGQVARVRGETLSADGTAAYFAKKNGCTGEPGVTPLPDTDPTDGTRVSLTRYERGCRAGVALYAIEGGGHTWPGGWQYAPELLIGRTSHDFSASEAAWAFFKGATR